MDKITDTINKIPGPSHNAMDQARSRQAELTKPLGSLGRLEELSIQIAGMTGVSRPKLLKKAVCVFAGDHGVAKEGVSAYPQEVTGQMVYNFLHGGAAINVLSRHAQMRVVVVDAGVAVDLKEHPELIVQKIGYGTESIIRGSAMTKEQALKSLLLGISTIEQEKKKGLDIVALGEMGIGNTTPSAAIGSFVTGIPVEKMTGKGTGIDDEKRLQKINIIKKALTLHQPNISDGFDLLERLGGFEIGAIAGAILGAASLKIPVVIDGFISTAGALIAYSLCPLVSGYLIASHVSAETGHGAMLEYLHLTPLFDFNMRLGEGTGAALAVGVAEAACKLLDEMSTFEEAGVAGKE
ncbi:MAG: nicotinate-nucleotide--dimethylbenzimidazole phosphoribosyltransferase [Spirochaetales bacterium]|nr:nicotinate-nucleotide--dimethylbenzimidazole phosphoribosyltransferase [Spirochaetales bacterium]